MENLECNLLPVPILNIKDMDDCILEGVWAKITDNDVVIEWDIRQKRKMAKFSVDPTHRLLDKMLVAYLRTLREQTIFFKEKKLLKDRILNHLKLFHVCYMELRKNNFMENYGYLDNIEKILLAVCNLELEVTRRMKRNLTPKEVLRYCHQAAQTMITILSVYLFQEKKRIFHVLLKLDYKYETPSWKNVMASVYKHFLLNTPVTDRSDESFCRHYLLFQKWKAITEDKQHASMDKVMFFKFRTTREVMLTNKNLRPILMPAADSLVDLVEVLTNGRQASINAYFQHLKKKTVEEECLPQTINLDSEGEEEDGASQKLVFNSDRGLETVVKSEQERNKKEQLSRENVQYFEMPVNGQVVCVIDDDSDVEEIRGSDDDNDDENESRREKATKRHPPTSFLDSIVIPQDELDTLLEAEAASTATTTTTETEKETDTDTTTIRSSSAPDKEKSSSPLPFLTTYLKYLRNVGSASPFLQARETNEDTLNMQSLHISETGTSSSTEMQVDANVNNEQTHSETEKEPPGDSQSNISNTSEPSDDISETLMESRKQMVDCGIQASFDETVVSEELEQPPNNSESEAAQCCDDAFFDPVSNGDVPADEEPTLSVDVQTNTDSTVNTMLNVDVDSSEPNNEAAVDVSGVEFLCGMITPPSDTTINDDDDDEVHSNPDTQNNHLNNSTDDDCAPNSPSNDYESENDHERCTETEETIESSQQLEQPPEENLLGETPDLHVEEVNLNEPHEAETASEEPCRPENVEETIERHEEIVTQSSGAVVEEEGEEEEIDESYMNLQRTIEKSQRSEELETSRKPKPSNTIVLSNVKITDSIGRNGDSHDTTIELFVQDIPDTILQALSVPQIEGGETATAQLDSNKKSDDSTVIVTNNTKIQASVNMMPYIQSTVQDKVRKRANGDAHDVSPEKIMYTSDERLHVLNTSLTEFTKFEEYHNDFFENGFAGPLRLMSNNNNNNNNEEEDGNGIETVEKTVCKPSGLNCEDLRPPVEPETFAKEPNLSGPVDDSPISPDYEAIHVLDFKNHIAAMDLGSLDATSRDKQKTGDVVIAIGDAMTTKTTNKQSEVVGGDLETDSATGKKRRRIETQAGGSSGSGTDGVFKKPRVNFGNYQVRYIPKSPPPPPPPPLPPILSDDVIAMLRDSVELYNVKTDDLKLLYLRPQVLVEMDSLSEVKEKQDKLKSGEKEQFEKVRQAIHDLLLAHMQNTERSSIVQRIDYKKSDDNHHETSSVSSYSSAAYSGNFVPNCSESARETTEDLFTKRLQDNSHINNSIKHLIMQQQESLANNIHNNNNNNNDNDKTSPTASARYSGDKFSELLEQCNTEILNLTVSSKSSSPSEIYVPESEFSRSPKFLQNSDQIVQHCLMDEAVLEGNEPPSIANSNDIAFLSNNSNFYGVGTGASVDVTTAAASTLFDGTLSPDDGCLDDDEINRMIDESSKNFESETCLPFKKRRVSTISSSMSSALSSMSSSSTSKPLSKCEVKYQPSKEEISYPATPMISIAELEALQQNERAQNRSFKTPAERKEMPPLPVFYNLNTTEPSPIITDQFNINNHTYNNPTINYHMSNMPMPFINVPCASYYPLPPILLPFNNSFHPFASDRGQPGGNEDVHSMAAAAAAAAAAAPTPQKATIKKERKRRTKKEKDYHENYYPNDYKKRNSRIV